MIFSNAEKTSANSYAFGDRPILSLTSKLERSSNPANNCA
jgi:hypothetical protein